MGGTVNGWHSKKYMRIVGCHFTQTDVDGNGPREVSYFSAGDRPYSDHGDERLVGVFPDLGQPGEDRRRHEWVPALSNASGIGGLYARAAKPGQLWTTGDSDATRHTFETLADGRIRATRPGGSGEYVDSLPSEAVFVMNLRPGASS